MTTNVILDNEVAIYIITSILIIAIFDLIVRLDNKFIKIFILELLKKIFIVVSLGFIIKNIIGDSPYKDIANIIYNSYLIIFIILITIYFIDTYIRKKKMLYYFKYINLSTYLFIFSMIVTNFRINMLIVNMLMILFFSMYKDIDNIENKFEKPINCIGFYKYIAIIIVQFILLINSFIAIKKQIELECILICLIYYFILKKYRREKDNSNIHSDYNKLSDIEINNKKHLFETRKKELEYIVNYFKHNNKLINEPFATSISGKWGEGKSSFVNVLKEELKNDYIIVDIQPMVVDTRESIIKYFFNTIEKKFIYYGISTGNGSSIEDYFNYILKLLNNKANISLNDIFSNQNENIDLRTSKNNLQQDINQLIECIKKKILIVIDDFDRVDNDVKYSILTFIKEVINFNGIESIILFDYSTLEQSSNNREISAEFLGKFIQKRFQLSTLRSEEIISFYEKYIYDNKIENDIFELKNRFRNLENLINYIYDDIDIYIDNQTKILEKLNKESNKKDIEIINNRIESLKKLKLGLTEKLSNTRKVKRIIREVKNSINYIEHIYSEIDNKYIKELTESICIEKIILIMEIIKVLFEESFNNIIKSNEITNYIRGNGYSKNEDDESLIELIFCTIIKSSNRLSMEYNLLNPDDEKALMFINNVYICINTPSDMFEFRDKEQIILDNISQNQVDLIDGNTRFEKFINIYKKLQFNNLKSKIDEISNIIYEDLNCGKLNIYEAIQLIRKESGFYGIVKSNRTYIKKLAKYLYNNKVQYDDIKQREYNLYTLNECKLEILNVTKKYIGYVLSYKHLNEKGNQFDLIMSEIETLHTIKDINEYVMTFHCNDLNIDTSLTDIDKFKLWCKIDSNEEYNIKYEFINEEINIMVDIIKDLNVIEKYIKESELEVYKMKNSYLESSFKEVIDEITVINKFVKNKDCDEEQRYQLIGGYTKLVYKLSKFNSSNKINHETIEIIDNIYRNMYKNPEFYKLKEEFDWQLLTLYILDIKNKVII